MKKLLIVIFFLVPLYLFAGGKKEAQVDTEEFPLYKDQAASIQARSADLLKRMTLEEKAGQMTLIARDYLDSEEDIAFFFLGGLLSGGGSAPPRNEPAAWADMYDRYQQQALSTRLGIPLIYGIDAVHGHNTVYGAVIFPHHIGMGCTRNARLVEEAARITAIEMAATGIDWNFSPCIAVARDERWGRTYESFGETPELAALLGAAEIRGLQGERLADRYSVLACAKHYAGDGGTVKGKDQGNTVCDEKTLRELHLAPYQSAIAAGVGSIMVSFSSWNGVKLHEHTYLLTAILKREFGFDKLLVSDWKAHDQLSGTMPEKVAKTVNAGLDMIMVPDDYRLFTQSLIAGVADGTITQSRIDDAVTKILKAKFALGLFEKPLTDRGFQALAGSEAHREVARQCVRESVVLLENKNDTLPLAKDLDEILVAGKNADDIGAQCGGWSMTWQGSRGKITVGTTVLEAVKKTVSPATKVIYSATGDGGKGAQAAIVVLGESPYAEMQGDSSDLSLDAADKAVLKKTAALGIPVIVILISGRPLILPENADWDALLAAWLPGTEAQGIADVLFGDYNPTGKLSHSWPRSMAQIPVNVGDAEYDPLYAYGFGLGYAEK